MSNPFKDSSVSAAATSTSNSNSKNYSAKSVYEDTFQEVTSNPMVQEVARNALMSGVSSGLFANKPPGLSGGSGGSNTRVADKNQAAVKTGEIPTTIDVEPVELEEMKKWAAKLRITMLIVCSLLMLASFFSLGSNDLTLVFIAMYVFFFSMLLCCYELGLQAIANVIAQNFGFMYNTIPRRVFVVLVAILCFELGLIGKISMGVLLGSECVHAYVVFKHPKFDYYMKMKHFYGVHDPTPRTNAVEDV